MQLSVAGYVVPEATQCLRRQGQAAQRRVQDNWTLKFKVPRRFETSESTRVTRQTYTDIPEDLNVQHHHCESRKCRSDHCTLNGQWHTAY
jgi:hypothetical protein